MSSRLGENACVPKATAIADAEEPGYEAPGDGCRDERPRTGSGTARQPDGRIVLQLCVSASDVRHLLTLDEHHYNSYKMDGGDLRLDGSDDAQEVWLCVVPDEVADRPDAYVPISSTFDP